MFIPTLIWQGTEEQKKKFLVPGVRLSNYYCYVQTELGHGSIYIPETDDILLI